MTRPENVGDLVQSRQRVRSYKVHKKVYLPEDEWIVIENVIPAIYTREEQKRINDILKKRAHVRVTRDEPHLFAGFLKCADCGRALTRKQCNRKSGKIYVYYGCARYKTHGKASGCSPHTVRENDVIDIVLQVIQKQIAVAIDLDEVLKKVNKADITKKQTLSCDSALELRTQELIKIKNIKRSLYEDWKNEDITRSEYIEMKEVYVGQELQLNQIIDSLKIEREKLTSKTYECSNYIDVFKKHENITELTRDVLSQLIDVILVHEDKSLTIKFRFADEFKQIKELLDEECNLNMAV